MLTTTIAPQLSQAASQALGWYASRIAGEVFADRLWNRHFTAEERRRLGGDLWAAYKQDGGSVGMWVKLRGVTPYRATLEVASVLNLIEGSDRDWLLREIGESSDVDEAMSAAIANGDLVIIERPRGVYWKRDEIEIDWNRHSAAWDFLWELVRYAKAGQPVDSFAFSDDAHRDIVAKRKSRLGNLKTFPRELAGQIEPVGRGTQQLKLPREQIHVFELDGLESLREWLP